MDYKIVKYNKRELEEFIHDEAFYTRSVIPISYHRALSYLNNPRLDEDDILINIAWKDDRIIGYRTVFPDYILNVDERIKCGWISGTWVDPEFRRQGIALKLFDEIYRDWSGKLLFTNYAPVSLKIYQSTNRFETFKTHAGGRFYLKSNLSELLINRYPKLNFLKPLLPIIDIVVNTAFHPFLAKPDSKPPYQLSIKESLNEQECNLLLKYNFTGRTKLEMDWIMKFPWVLSAEQNEISNKYAFSSVANPFKQYFCLLHKNNELKSIVMLTVKGKQLKVPYIYSKDSDYSTISELIFNEGAKNGVSHIDIFNESLLREMKLKSKKYIFFKSQERKYVFSKELIPLVPDNQEVKIQDGDGDVVFV